MVSSPRAHACRDAVVIDTSEVLAGSFLAVSRCGRLNPGRRASFSWVLSVSVGLQPFPNGCVAHATYPKMET